jgi:hypothetical protein
MADNDPSPKWQAFVKAYQQHAKTGYFKNAFPALKDSALDTIFRKARTQNKWFDKPVSREQLVALYDLMRWGPTSANCSPARIVFVTTPAAKERLRPLVLEGNPGKR